MSIMRLARDTFRPADAQSGDERPHASRGTRVVNLALVEPGPCGWPAMRARIDLEDGDAEHSQAREADAVPSGFARLLARLNPDLDEAGQEYQRLRTRLVRFFDWRGATQPDECADETLDRLARKLEEAEVEVLDVQKYVYGIARLVHLEQRRRPAWRGGSGRRCRSPGGSSDRRLRLRPHRTSGGSPAPTGSGSPTSSPRR